MPLIMAFTLFAAFMKFPFDPGNGKDVRLAYLKVAMPDCFVFSNRRQVVAPFFFVV